MKDKAVYKIELEQDMERFLQDMVKKYQLPDVSKAARCLVNYARENVNKQDEIFGSIRCLDC